MCLLLKGEPGKENGREMDMEMANGKWKWKWKILYFLNHSGSCVFSCLSYSFFYCDLKFQDFRPSQSHCMWSVRVRCSFLACAWFFPFHDSSFSGWFGTYLPYLPIRYAMHSSLRLQTENTTCFQVPPSNRWSSCFGSRGLRRWQLLFSGYLELVRSGCRAMLTHPVLQLSRLRQVAGCDCCCVMLEVVKMDFTS